MKKFFFLCMICFLTLSAQTQNVGIGTTTPVQKLHVEGTTYLNGNVGIGASTPAFPLSFGTALGDKISLWSNSTNSYGFGIQSGLLQIHTDISGADIAFGYGSSTAFTEKMRIKGDGNVGIGITSPTASLEVARGTGAGGTAVFRGTTNMSHFNFGTDEDTYIRAGKDNRYVILNDIPGGKVGIGTTTPNAPLGFPATLGKKITLYPGVTGDVGLAVEGNLLQMYADHPNADIAFGYDQGGVFTERMRIKGNGNVGIGTTTPDYLLSFANNVGDKIGLYGGAGNHYGIGIQGFMLQIYSDASNSDIAFGYGSSSSFTETMRIKGNGNAGIGNSNPAYQLDISNRMRIRSGGNNTVSAGLWLNNNANTEAAFFGMEDDTHVGLFGNGGAGWKFSMNTQTGALKINGTEGTDGQILRSNGSGSSPTWMNKPYTVWYNQSGLVALDGSNLIVPIPNINGQTLVLSQPSYISYQFTIPLYGNNGTFGGGSAGIVNIQFLDGGNNVISSASSQFNIGNLVSSQVVVTGIGDMPAGTFTIVARLGRVAGAGNTNSNAGTVSGIPIQVGQLIVQVFPK